jgi:hypothetical protein
MNIINHIPYGKSNAITRPELCDKTGLSDRILREKIAQERRHNPILNDQSGNGYYRPTPDEIEDARKVQRQEQKRARSVFWSMRGLNKWLKEVEKG